MKKHIIAIVSVMVLCLASSAAARNNRISPASPDSVTVTQTAAGKEAVSKAPAAKSARKNAPAAKIAVSEESSSQIAVTELSAEEIMSSPVGTVLVSRFDDMLTERLDEYDSRMRSRSRFPDQKTIGVVAVFFLPFVFAITALVLFTRYLNCRGERRAKLIELSLRSGQPLPPEFYQRRKRNQVQTGLTWIAWGAGLMIFFLVVGAEPPAALMAVPCLIGVSKLITILIESRNGGRAE